MAPRALLELSHSSDCDQWARLHTAGDVPDRWPYGLDRLANHGLEPVVDFRRPGRARTRLNLLARQVGRYQWGEEARRLPDGIDVRIAWSELGGVPAALRGGPPVVGGVIWLTEQSRRSPQRLAAIRALRRMSAVWTLSDAQLPVLRRLGVADRRLHHLSFGVDSTFFTPAGSHDGDLVVSAGNDASRDHSTLIGAMEAVRRAAPTARLLLATRRPVPTPDDPDEIVTHLTHAQLRDQYRRAAVVAVALAPNLHVSGITAVLEAMACGRPVVVTDTPGMRHYVDHGVNGLLVPAGDRAAMASAVADLLRDPHRAAAMGRAGRMAVETSFNTEEQARAIAAITLAVLSH